MIPPPVVAGMVYTLSELHPERVNENQGAESTLAFLMALVEMRLLGEVNHPRSRRDLFIARNNNLETAHVL